MSDETLVQQRDAAGADDCGGSQAPAVVGLHCDPQGHIQPVPVQPAPPLPALWVRFRRDGERGIDGLWDFQPWQKDSEYVCGVAHKYVLAVSANDLAGQVRRALDAASHIVALHVSRDVYDATTAAAVEKDFRDALEPLLGGQSE